MWMMDEAEAPMCNSLCERESLSGVGQASGLRGRKGAVSGVDPSDPGVSSTPPWG